MWPNDTSTCPMSKEEQKMELHEIIKVPVFFLNSLFGERCYID